MHFTVISILKGPYVIPQFFSDGPCQVELFGDSNYQGGSKVYTRSSTSVTPDNGMSSLKVSEGCCVIIYEDVNYGGNSKKICKNMHWDQDWNDKVSSLKIESPTQGRSHPSSLPRPGSNILPGCTPVSLGWNPGDRGALDWPWNQSGCTPANKKCKTWSGWKFQH